MSDWNGAITLPVLTVEGAFGWGTGAISLPFSGVDADTGSIRDGFIVSGSWIQMWGGAIDIPIPEISGHYIAGNVWSCDIEIPVLSVSGNIPSTAWLGALHLPVVQIAGTMLTGEVFSGQIIIPIFRVRGSAYIIPKFTGGTISVPLPSLLGYFRVNPNEPLRKAVVVNIAHGGVSEYPNFPFNSFGYFNGLYLGANSNGIYLLGGDTDAGSNIEAELRIPLQDLGLPIPQRLREAWLNFRSDGNITLVVQVEEDTVWTRDIAFLKDQIHEARAKIARGIVGRFFALGIRNVNGSDFDLARMRVTIDVIKRKIR